MPCRSMTWSFFTNKKSKTNAEVSQAMLEAAIPVLEGTARLDARRPSTTR